MASSSFGPNGIAASLNEMESMAFDLGTHLEEVPHISVSGKMATVTVTVRVRPLVPFMSTHITNFFIAFGQGLVQSVRAGNTIFAGRPAQFILFELIFAQTVVQTEL